MECVHVLVRVCAHASVDFPNETASTFCFIAPLRPDNSANCRRATANYLMMRRMTGGHAQCYRSGGNDCTMHSLTCEDTRQKCERAPPLNSSLRRLLHRLQKLLCLCKLLSLILIILDKILELGQ